MHRHICIYRPNHQCYLVTSKIMRYIGNTKVVFDSLTCKKYNRYKYVSIHITNEIHCQRYFYFVVFPGNA